MERNTNWPKHEFRLFTQYGYSNSHPEDQRFGHSIILIYLTLGLECTHDQGPACTLYSSNHAQQCKTYAFLGGVTNRCRILKSLVPFYFQNLERPAAHTHLVPTFDSSCAVPAVSCASRPALGF